LTIFARKIGGKIAGSIEGKIVGKTAKWIDGRTVARTDRLIVVREVGRMQAVSCEDWIGPIALPVSMGERAVRMLAPLKWIARTGRRDRTDSRGLTGRIVQIVWNDRSVRIDLTGRNVQSVRTNQSGPAGTNTAGVSYWKMIWKPGGMNTWRPAFRLPGPQLLNKNRVHGTLPGVAGPRCET